MYTTGILLFDAAEELDFVGQLHDRAYARATQRSIQYDPAPSYAPEV